MKKVVATTMATLLFGLSFPVNTFALPNNEVIANSQVLEKVSLPNSGDGSQSEAGADNKAKEDTIAKKIEGKLEAKDISVWQNDIVNWKDGVKLKTDNAEYKGYLEGASVTDLDNRNTDNSNTDTGKVEAFQGRLRVEFTDGSVIEIANQKLYVTSKMTNVANNKAPENAVDVKLQLGEGVKDSNGTMGNKDKPVEYGSYRIKPGVNILNEEHPKIKNSLFKLVNLQVSDPDKYVDPQWKSESANGKDFVVSKDNNIFTATASKLFKMTFKFAGFDKDSNEEIQYDNLPKLIKDKLPKEERAKEGGKFETKPIENVTENISGSDGEISKVYVWTFGGWNPSSENNIQEDKTFRATWGREQARSEKAEVTDAKEGNMSILGKGKAGSEIKIFLPGASQPTIVKVNESGQWKVDLPDGKTLKANDKLSFAQIEKGKKESEIQTFKVLKKLEQGSPSEGNPAPGQKEENKPSKPSKENSKDKGENKNSQNILKRKEYTRRDSNSSKVYVSDSNEVSKKETFSKPAKYTLSINSGEYEALIDGQVIKRQMDVKPLIKNDRLMLPLRSLAEMIGAKVEWDSQTRTAIFINKGLVAKIQIDGNEIVLSNGKVIKMDSKPLNINGRILLPISNVANVFGLTNGNTKDGIDQNIEWDGDNKTVEINLNK